MPARPDQIGKDLQDLHIKRLASSPSQLCLYISVILGIKRLGFGCMFPSLSAEGVTAMHFWTSAWRREFCCRVFF